MKLKSRHRSLVLPLLVTFWLLNLPSLRLIRWLWAAEVDPKPGDTIGPHNWQKVEGMVGENLLNRIKQGYTFKIRESRRVKSPTEYLEATEKYSSQVRL